MKHARIWLTAISLLLLFCLNNCSRALPTAIPSATPLPASATIAPVQSATQAQTLEQAGLIPSSTPLASATASATLNPSSTPLPPPSATNTTSAETPTATLSASATPQADVPSETPTTAPQIAPANTLASAPNLAEQGLNPLTGLPIAAELANLRPINVKVSNLPACVRPQSGLALADVVFEHYVEAWYTRFTAIFHSQYPEKVGSVRSARMLDLELPAIFDAGFEYSGASAGVIQRIKRSDFSARVLTTLEDYPALFRIPIGQTNCAEGPHNMFANTSQAQELLAKRGQATLTAPLTGWQFSNTPPTGEFSANHVEVLYLNAPISWDYSPESGSYLRKQGTAKHTDAITKQQLQANNVVMIFANQVYTDFPESPSWYSLEIQFWGNGYLILFRDGQAYTGHWERQQRSGLFRMFDAQGNVLLLKPGNTWFEMVDNDTRHAHDAEGRWQFDPDELPLQPVVKIPPTKTP